MLDARRVMQTADQAIAPEFGNSYRTLYSFDTLEDSDILPYVAEAELTCLPVAEAQTLDR